MPIILWGSRGLTSHLDSGRFYCPGCDKERDYDRKQVRPFFTLYFIPLFPIGAAQRYIECRSCGGTYKEEVLDMQPPGEGERLMMSAYGDLREGYSVEEVRRELIAHGVDRDRAEQIVDDMTRGDTWVCGGCGQHYLKSVRDCRTCQG